MIQRPSEASIIQEYLAFIKADTFPCIAAKAALAKQQIKCMVADHMACPKDDKQILDFIYAFVDTYRQSKDLYHSVAIIFKAPEILDEDCFDTFMWSRLQSLKNLDAENYSYDQRVDEDPFSAKFSFSLKQEAFFIIGLHPGNSRLTRRFKYPVLTFNPHAQFETLRDLNKFESMQKAVRNKDLKYSGSVNPMLEDYGVASEVFQYSGKIYDKQWKCPLTISNAKSDHNSST